MRRPGLGMAVLATLCLLIIGPASRAGEPQELVAVLAARRDVPPFEALKKPEMYFKVVHYLKGDEPRDAVTDFAQVKGQRLVRRLVEDQPLKKIDIADNPAAGTYVGRPEGTRVVALEIEQGLIGLLLPGCHVDVAVVTTEAGKEPTCKVVMEDLLLHAADGFTDRLHMTATVAVTLEQAVKLADAVKAGNVHLVLRPPGKERDDDKQTGLVAVPKDMRGVAMKCDPKSLADGFILPGSRVDVIVRKPKSDKESVTKTVGENLLVLAVDTDGDGRDKEPTSCVVTLAVPQGQVEKLLAGTAAGKVAFVLRSPDK